MSYTLASVASQIAALLNDSAQSNYTNAVLLPHAKNACDELQLELESNGILVLEKIFTAIVIAVGVKVIDSTTTPALPTDLLDPQKLEERLSGSSDLYQPMIRREWEPDILPSDSLNYWSWREQSLFFVGATSIRDVKIYGLKSGVSITADTTPITIFNSQQFFINRTAALAAGFRGENPERAAALAKIADDALTKLINIGVKNKQGVRTRRRPFRIIGRRWWS